MRKVIFLIAKKVSKESVTAKHFMVSSGKFLKNLQMLEGPKRPDMILTKNFILAYKEMTV